MPKYMKAQKMTPQELNLKLAILAEFILWPKKFVG